MPIRHQISNFCHLSVTKTFKFGHLTLKYKTMNYPIYFKRIAFFCILTIFSVTFAFAQAAKSTEPRQEKLLNGLKLLVWTEPTAEKLTIKLRIHSGSAFDPKDKMGAMALLAEILFPNEQSKALFTEDLNGSLDITTTYDYIQITATGKPDEALTMIQTIANAVTRPQITPDNFKIVRDARLKKVQELEKNPVYVADRAAAKRFYGEFPYGRNAEGTPESLAKLDYADLLFAKERFLTSDNATLTISGNIKFDYAYRVSRQLFGTWVKSDKKVPATFTMPNEPDVTPQMIDFSKTDPNSAGNEIRFATRGLARNDKDYFAIRFLATLLQDRFRAKVGSDLQSGVSVTHERTLLPGLVFFKFSFRPQNNAAESVNPIIWLKEPITSAEFEQTRTKVLAEIEAKSMADKMLDIDTFKLVSVKDEMQKLNSVTQADVQRIADKLAKQSFVTVSLNNQVAKQ